MPHEGAEPSGRGQLPQIDLARLHEMAVVALDERASTAGQGETSIGAEGQGGDGLSDSSSKSGRQRPLSVSHTFSCPQVKSRSPSLRTRKRALPDSGEAAIGAEGDRMHGTGMAAKDAQEPAGHLRPTGGRCRRRCRRRPVGRRRSGPPT